MKSKSIKNIKNRRTKQPKTKTTWVWKGYVREIYLKERSKISKWKGKQKKQNNHVLSKRVDEEKLKCNDGIWKGIQQEKQKKKPEKEKDLMKGLWGEQKSKQNLKLQDTVIVYCRQ